MTIDPVQLLRKLEPAVRPVSGATRPHDAAAPFEQRGFDELLALVSTGALGDSLPVHLAPGVELDEPLEEEQLGRLAAAADMAAAAGARRAVMLVDGRGLVLDVAARALTSELTAESHELVEIDAAVYVAAAGSEPSRRGAPPFPGTGLVPPGIAKHFGADTEETNQSNHTARRAG